MSNIHSHTFRDDIQISRDSFSQFSKIRFFAPKNQNILSKNFDFVILYKECKYLRMIHFEGYLMNKFHDTLYINTTITGFLIQGEYHSLPMQFNIFNNVKNTFLQEQE